MTGIGQPKVCEHTELHVHAAITTMSQAISPAEVETPVTVDSKVRKSNNAIKKPEKNLIDQVSTNMEMSPVGIGSRKVGRNEICTCDSGKKYKRCQG